MLNIVSVLLVLTAVFAYLTHRYTKFPTTIGVMASALLFSLALAGLDKLGLSALKSYEDSLLRSIDFTAVLLQGMTLASRFLVAGAPVAAWYRAFGLPRGSARVLTWGGLRRGISVALALSLPQGPEREVIVMLTYSVVLFSIFVQGLTVGAVARSLTSRR